MTRIQNGDHPYASMDAYVQAKPLFVHALRRTTRDGKIVRVNVEVRPGFKRFWGFTPNRANIDLIADGYADNPRPEWGITVTPVEESK